MTVQNAVRALVLALTLGLAFSLAGCGKIREPYKDAPVTNVIGVRCFGVAVRYQRPARDAISCSVPVARLTPGREEQLVEAVLSARDRLERLLR
jgi:hypothetical protein